MASLHNPITQFFKVPFSLEDQVIVCTLEISKSHYLIERENGVLTRISKLRNILFPIKIFVHHQLYSFRRYIFILTYDYVAHLFDFDTLEVVRNWQDINEIQIKECDESGSRKIWMTNLEGSEFLLNEQDFRLRSSTVTSSSISANALSSLHLKLKSRILIDSLTIAERRRKETFLNQKISTLRKLQTELIDSSSCCIKQDSFSKDIEPINVQYPSLNITSVHQRVINGNLILCVTLTNNSRRSVVVNPELNLSAWNITDFRFCSYVLEVFYKNSSNDVKSGTYIKILQPPILKAHKKAFMIATCEIVHFPFKFSSEKLILEGGISFTTRPCDSKEIDDSNTSSGLIPMSSIELLLTKLKSISMNAVLREGYSGTPVDLIALLGTSRQQSFLVKSLVTPLTNFAEQLESDSRIRKIPHWNDFYCFDVSSCNLLYMACFFYKLQGTDKIKFIIFTRTECQEKVLFYQLQSFLPKDVIFLRENTAFFQENPRDALITAVRSVLADVLQVFSTKSDEDEPNHRHLELPTQSKSLKKLNFKFSGQDYLKWRRSLIHSLLNIEKCFEECGL